MHEKLNVPQKLPCYVSLTLLEHITYLRQKVPIEFWDDKFELRPNKKKLFVFGMGVVCFKINSFLVQHSAEMAWMASLYPKITL